MTQADFDALEAALVATMQAAEYRVPYAPPPTWPLYECDHQWLDITRLGSPTELLCKICGENR